MIFAVALALTIQQPAKSQTLYDMLGIAEPGLRGAALEAAVAKAAASPLGSEANPVRAQGPAGEREYLARLRCADGRPPEVLGRGSAMPGPFGGIADVYRLRCAGSPPVESGVFFDMYHQHRETRPIPGFTLAR